jgi:hypothetical protein
MKVQNRPSIDFGTNPVLLAQLTDMQLEDLWDRANISGNYDCTDAVIAELLHRPTFCPVSYDLLWELQDNGWNGGVTQEERDAR